MVDVAGVAEAGGRTGIRQQRLVGTDLDLERRAGRTGHRRYHPRGAGGFPSPSIEIVATPDSTESRFGPMSGVGD